MPSCDKFSLSLTLLKLRLVHIIINRVVSMVAIALTLYGGCCVFIVLISQLLGSLVAAAGLHLTLCSWMVIVATGLTPLTWMGTPKDFWGIAVGRANLVRILN